MEEKKNNSDPVVILGYHDIVDSQPRERYTITRDSFQRQLSWLKENNFRAISLLELHRVLTSGNPPAQKSVVLTFDDGLLSHLDLAFPLLKEYGFPACFFIIAGFVGKSGFMNWEQLQQLDTAGMQIGSHGLSHNLLNLMSEEKVKEEFTISKSLLEKNLKRPIEMLSIPRGQDSPKIRALARALGYNIVCVSSPGHIYKNSSPYLLHRFFLQNNYPFDDFKKIMQGRPSIYARIRIKRLAILLLQSLFGMKLYEKMRMKLLKDDYSH